MIQSTWNTPYLSITPGIYPTFTTKIHLPQVDHTDGLGTKGYFHWKKRTFKAAVLDSLAMNLNDLALVGARAYKLQNHIVLPKDDHKAILQIVEALTDECKKRKIAMTGGETSIHEGTDFMDLSITVSGFIEKPVENKVKPGDVVVGFASNGLHSNGFTKVQQILGSRVKTEYTQPTAIYADEVLKLMKTIQIHGMMHITGGAFTKLKDLLHNEDIYINSNHSLQPQSIFSTLHKKGVSDRDMYRTFNCGVGFVIFINPKDIKKVKTTFKTDVIGEVTTGIGKTVIHSKFSNRTITF
jgi:phosphoribosylaminoimidazole synthetase